MVGGSGTLLGALAYGIPQLYLPQGADQFHLPQGADQFRNAEACRAAGAGICLKAAEATTERIEAALRQLLTKPLPRRNAERLAAEIAGMPSLEEAVHILEQLAGCG